MHLRYLACPRKSWLSAIGSRLASAQVSLSALRSLASVCPPTPRRVLLLPTWFRASARCASKVSLPSVLGTAPHDVRPSGQLAVYFCFYLFLLVAAMTPRDVLPKEGNVVQLPRARFTVRLTHAAEGFLSMGVSRFYTCHGPFYPCSLSYLGV